MNWVQSLTKAIQFIESNLTHAITVNDVANHVYASSTHFQRVFSWTTGITIGDYIRNRRLSLAGHDLLLSANSIIDIAMKYQYDSQESFTKAFTRFHGLTPKSALKQSHKLKHFRPLTINITIQGGLDMSINRVISTLEPYKVASSMDNKINGAEVPFLFKKEIVSLPKSLLIGRKVTYPIDKQGVPVEDGGNPPLNLLWHAYLKDGTRDWLIQHKSSMFIEAALGYYFDININDSGTFSYMVGSFMNADTVVPQGWDCHDVPAGEFVICWYKYKENEDDIWAVAHSTVEAYMKEIGYTGNGVCSELYPFDDEDDGYSILGYLIAGKKE